MANIVIIHENNWRLTSAVTKQKSSSIFLIYLLYYCIIYMLSMKKRIGAEIKKIKNLKFICPMGQDSQRNGQRDGERKKLGKKFFFENSFY